MSKIVETEMARRIIKINLGDFQFDFNNCKAHYLESYNRHMQESKEEYVKRNVEYQYYYSLENWLRKIIYAAVGPLEFHVVLEGTTHYNKPLKEIALYLTPDKHCYKTQGNKIIYTKSKKTFTHAIPVIYDDKKSYNIITGISIAVQSNQEIYIPGAEVNLHIALKVVQMVIQKNKVACKNFVVTLDRENQCFIHKKQKLEAMNSDEIYGIVIRSLEMGQ